MCLRRHHARSRAHTHMTQGRRGQRGSPRRRRGPGPKEAARPASNASRLGVPFLRRRQRRCDLHACGPRLGTRARRRVRVRIEVHSQRCSRTARPLVEVRAGCGPARPCRGGAPAGGLEWAHPGDEQALSRNVAASKAIAPMAPTAMTSSPPGAVLIAREVLSVISPTGLAGRRRLGGTVVWGTRPRTAGVKKASAATWAACRPMQAPPRQSGSQ